jgi:ABC-type phosphate/phosphonate transport system substrate-binding protein
MGEPRVGIPHRIISARGRPIKKSQRLSLATRDGSGKIVDGESCPGLRLKGYRVRNPFFRLTVFLGGLGVSTLGVSAPVLAGAAPLNVGMTRSFFHDMSPLLIETVTEPFVTTMRETAGLSGKLVLGGGAFAVAQQLNDKQLQLGVFHGFEFAWVQKKYPELRPIMVAVNKEQPLRAFLLVPKDSATKTFADLKGKVLGVPKRTKEHCRYFVEHLARGAGAADTKAFFAKVLHGASVETALNELAAGKTQAALVDATGLDFYKDLNPGRFAKLRVLAQSEVFFPSMVIAYRQGGLDEPTLAKVRNGLRATGKSETGRDMLKTWNLTSIEPVPANFVEVLAASLKTFPMLELKK